MAKFLFRLENMHVAFQRNRTGHQDVDVIAFGTRVAGANIGPISGTVLASSGDTIQFADHLRPNSLRVPSGHWEIGPTEIGADDSVDIAYTVTNIAQSPQGHPTPEEVETIGFGTWAAAVAVAGAATGGAAAVAVAVIAGLAAIGQAILSIFFKNVNCNGVVGADKIPLRGSDLVRQTDNADKRFLMTSNAGNPDIPSDCGHPSEINVVISISKIPFYSLRQFFSDKLFLRLGGGIRSSLSAPFPKLFQGSTTSVRDIIETWELIVTA